MFVTAARSSRSSFARVGVFHLHRDVRRGSICPGTIARATQAYRAASLKSQHVPFKQKLWADSGFVSGVDNVQHGVADVGVDKADSLVPPNGKWRCTLDPFEWSMWDANNSMHFFFRKTLPNPSKVVLGLDGRLTIVDIDHKVIWKRGPYPDTIGPYELRCEDEPDLALYDGRGQKLWSARRDDVQFVE